MPPDTYAIPVRTQIHADRKCRWRPQPDWPVRSIGSGRSTSEGVPRAPVSPQYKRGCASRMAIPLTASAAKLAAVSQCVTRTSAECRTRTFYALTLSGVCALYFVSCIRFCRRRRTYCPWLEAANNRCPTSQASLREAIHRRCVTCHGVSPTTMVPVRSIPVALLLTTKKTPTDRSPLH